MDTVFDTELEFSSPAFAEVLGRRVQLIPALHTLLKVDDAGHELLGKKALGDVPLASRTVSAPSLIRKHRFSSHTLSRAPAH